MGIIHFFNDRTLRQLKKTLQSHLMLFLLIYALKIWTLPHSLHAIWLFLKYISLFWILRSYLTLDGSLLKHNWGRQSPERWPETATINSHLPRQSMSLHPPGGGVCFPSRWIAMAWYPSLTNRKQRKWRRVGSRLGFKRPGGFGLCLRKPVRYLKDVESVMLSDGARLETEGPQARMKSSWTVQPSQPPAECSAVSDPVKPSQPPWPTESWEMTIRHCSKPLSFGGGLLLSKRKLNQE